MQREFRNMEYPPGFRQFFVIPEIEYETRQ